MKTMIQQLFLSLTAFCFVHQNLQAMEPAKQLSRPSHTTIAHRKLCKRVLEPAKLDEFRDHGTVFHGKKIQDIIPDNIALEILKPADIDLVCRFDHNIPKLKTTLPGFTNCFSTRLVSHDDSRIITVLSNGKVTISTLQSNGSWSTQELEGKLGQLQSVAFSSNDSHIIIASNNGAARILTLQANGSYIPTQVLEESTNDESTNRVNTAAFDHNNSRVIIASDDGTVSIWTLQRPRGSYIKTQILAMDDSDDKGNLKNFGATFSHDDSFIITSSDKITNIVQLLDLVEKQHIAAKILLLKLLKRGDVEAVRKNNHLKQLFATLNPHAQEYLDKTYDIVEKPEQCGICLSGKYAEEVIHPTCCNSNQTICLECYNKLNRCPFCRADDFQQQSNEPAQNGPTQTVPIYHVQNQRTSHSTEQPSLESVLDGALIGVLISIPMILIKTMILKLLKRSKAIRKARSITNKSITTKNTPSSCTQDLSQKPLIQTAR